MLLNDKTMLYGETINEYFINLTIMMNNYYMLQLVCYILDIEFLLPEYDNLLDLKYIENKKFINTRRDFEYIIKNLDVFEEIFQTTNVLYNAGKNTHDYCILRFEFEEYLQRTLTQYECMYLANESKLYAKYMDT
jgi:hypothetical protein